MGGFLLEEWMQVIDHENKFEFRGARSRGDGDDSYEVKSISVSSGHTCRRSLSCFVEVGLWCLGLSGRGKAQGRK